MLICGTGIGMSIVANKYRGVRAAVCCTEFEARATRQHNDANVLCLGERVVGGPGWPPAIAERVRGHAASRAAATCGASEKIADAEAENCK